MSFWRSCAARVRDLLLRGSVAAWRQKKFLRQAFCFCAARARRTRARLPQVRSLHHRLVLALVGSWKTQRQSEFAQILMRSISWFASISPNEAAIRACTQSQSFRTGTASVRGPFWFCTSFYQTGTFNAWFSFEITPPRSWPLTPTSTSSWPSCSVGSSPGKPSP